MENDDDLSKDLVSGREAAELVMQHMERMGAAATEWLFPSKHGMWRVSVELITLDGYRGKATAHD